MYKDARAAGHRSHREGAVCCVSPVFQLRQGLTKGKDEKPHCYPEPGAASLDQQLQVVVVSLIDKKTGIEAAELWIDHGESAESPSNEWLLPPHPQGITIDCEAHATR